MITKKVVLGIHKILIEKYGGMHGIRDLGALESALSRPYSTFDSIELYPTPEEKAAAIIESILINHPFLDGNKRTGYILSRLIILGSNKDLDASEDEKYQFVIDIASGKIRFDEIILWIKNHINN